jgi:hypothetical protein
MPASAALLKENPAISGHLTTSRQAEEFAWVFDVQLVWRFLSFFPPPLPRGALKKGCPTAASGAYVGGDDAFYARLEPSGASVSYSTYISGSGSENASQVVLDSAGAAYITGSSDSADLTNVAALQPSLRGESDAWLMKIGGDGALKYITYFVGSGCDTGNSLTVRANSVFVAGSTCSESSRRLSKEGGTRSNKAGEREPKNPPFLPSFCWIYGAEIARR